MLTRWYLWITVGVSCWQRRSLCSTLETHVPSIRVFGILTKLTTFSVKLANIRSQAGDVAIYFIILGIGNLLGSFFQFWGIAQMGERASSEMRGYDLHLIESNAFTKYYKTCRIIF